MDTRRHASHHHQTAAGAPEPVTIARWQHAIQRARAAQQLGQWRMALVHQHQALALSLRLLEHAVPVGREDDCIAAVVVSQLKVADLQAQGAALHEAAVTLARAHAALLGLMADAQRGPALQQAAWRHSRETHAALLRHIEAHGPHPGIAQTLEAARMAGSSGPH